MDGNYVRTAVREAKRRPGKKAAATLNDDVIPNAASRAKTKSDFLKMSLAWAAPSMESVSQVREGLAVKTLDGMDSIVPGVTYRIVPKSTLAALKKRSERLPAEQSNRVYQTGKVIGFAMALYRDEEKVREFLMRRHPMLEDRRPLDVALESGAGADMVINLLGRGAYGGGA